MADIYGVKMSLTFHAIFYHINSDDSVGYRTEVHDQMAHNERGQNMVILDTTSAFKLCFNTCVELYNHYSECLNPQKTKMELHSVRITNLTLYKYKMPRCLQSHH